MSANITFAYKLNLVCQSLTHIPNAKALLKSDAEESRKLKINKWYNKSSDSVFFLL